MKRPTAATLLALAIVLALGAFVVTRPVPYVTMSPGPTVNVLGKFSGKPIIQVTGRKEYRDPGGLRLLTVVESGPQDRVSLTGMVWAWADPSQAVFPRRAVYGDTDTNDSVQQQSTQQMDTSQGDAVAAALTALHIHFTTYPLIDQVQKGGPAEGRLRTGDRVLKVDGHPVGSYTQLAHRIQPLAVGSRLTLVVRRKGKDLVEHLTTTKSPSDPTKSAVLVTVAPGYDFPFPVKLNISPNIGGPSGGLMFSMGIYDVLTPGSLTGGAMIAGTGEIDQQGDVGEIGGIQQKMVAAQAAGAKLFLSPVGNCAEALGAHYDPDKMRLVKVSSLQGALADVKAWVKDRHARLPRCTR